MRPQPGDCVTECVRLCSVILDTRLPRKTMKVIMREATPSKRTAFASGKSMLSPPHPPANKCHPPSPSPPPLLLLPISSLLTRPPLQPFTSRPPGLFFGPIFPTEFCSQAQPPSTLPQQKRNDERESSRCSRCQQHAAAETVVRRHPLSSSRRGLQQQQGIVSTPPTSATSCPRHSQVH